MRRWQCHELICGAEPIVMSQVAQRLNSSLLGLFCQHNRYDLYYGEDADIAIIEGREKISMLAR